jgi:hypothetical protein
MRVMVPMTVARVVVMDEVVAVVVDAIGAVVAPALVRMANQNYPTMMF